MMSYIKTDKISMPVYTFFPLARNTFVRILSYYAQAFVPAAEESTQYGHGGESMVSMISQATFVKIPGIEAKFKTWLVLTVDTLVCPAG
jgi:hypothetical protein